MSRRGAVSSESIRFALADSVAFLNARDWDSVSARSGLFLSRRFLELLEQNLPENLTPHYALAYSENRPVAAIVVQSLDIRVADLSSPHSRQDGQGLWRALGKASVRSISRHRRILLFGAHLPWAGPGGAAQAADEPELWPEVASSLSRQWHGLLKTAERAAEFPVAWIHQQMLVCGNLLSTGPLGVAFAEGEDPAQLWPAVEEAMYRIHRSMKLSSDFDLIMIKDLTDDQKETAAALRHLHFRRFETEPNMILHFKPCWRSFDDYLADMRSEYRSRIRKTIGDLGASGVVLESLSAEQVKARASEIHRLYLQVHERQKLRLVTIHPQWISALATSFGEEFRTVIARPRDGNKLLGFVNVIRDGVSAHGYYIGFDKATAARGVPLYLGLMYAAVGQAIAMGVDQMLLGRTALGPKAQIGASAQPMYGYLRHRNPALNLAVPSVLALLPAPAEAPERHPFKNVGSRRDLQRASGPLRTQNGQ
jgi:predicted N-acyltransferase